MTLHRSCSLRPVRCASSGAVFCRWSNQIELEVDPAFGDCLESSGTVRLHLSGLIIAILTRIASEGVLARQAAAARIALWGLRNLVDDDQDTRLGKSRDLDRNQLAQLPAQKPDAVFGGQRLFVGGSALVGHDSTAAPSKG